MHLYMIIFCLFLFQQKKVFEKAWAEFTDTLSSVREEMKKLAS